MNKVANHPNAALSSDLPTLTAEINAYQRVAGEAIFEIGKRLKHVKENDLAHGEWSRWCKEGVGMTVGNADKFVVVYERLKSNHSTSSSLGVSALYEIATLPPDEREQPHTIPSTGATKTPDEMTVRELREVKQALKAARQSESIAISRADRAEGENVTLRDTLESVTSVPPETVRIVDESNRKQFYADFIDELEYIRSKYGAVALEGAKLREAVEYDDAKCRRLDDFDDFWQAFAKSAYKNQTIIEMGNV